MTKRSPLSPADGLPTPRWQGPRSLEEALASRRSVREFTNEPLTAAEISQLLWATQGITADEGLRAAPSAGGLYPLELYVATSSGLDHYVPARHALVRCGDRDLRPVICRAALDQDAILQAPAVFVIAAECARTQRKYGERAARYVSMEVGHAAQNLLLQAAALDLCGVPLGAFEDRRLREVLGLPHHEVPLYLIPIGHAK